MAGTVTLSWPAIDATGTIYTGYRVALTGVVSPPEQYVPLGTLTALFASVTPGDYTGVVQLSVADLSEVDTNIVFFGDVTVNEGGSYFVVMSETPGEAPVVISVPTTLALAGRSTFCQALCLSCVPVP